MKALRQIQKPVNHQIIITLPDDFSEDEVEIIIMPKSDPQEIDSCKVSRRELYGKYKGKIRMSPDFNEPLEDFKEYME